MRISLEWNKMGHSGKEIIFNIEIINQKKSKTFKSRKLIT